MTMTNQEVVDNMVAGYISMMTPYEAKVTDSGEVSIIGKTANFIVDTATDDEKLILTIIDHDDPFLPIEETPKDLDKIAERLTEIHALDTE